MNLWKAFKLVDIKALKLVDINTEVWKREASEISLSYRDDSFHYLGEVLKSIPAIVHTLEFEVQTVSWKSSRISIPLIFSHDAVAKISILGENIIEKRLIANNHNENFIDFVEADITNWAIKHKIQRVQLQIKFENNKGGILTIPVDQNQPRFFPSLLQGWNKGLFFSSVTFYLLLWMMIQAVFLIIAANISSKSFIRDTTIIALAGGWIISLLGIPDLARVPIWKYMRFFYSITRLHFLSTITIVVIVLAGLVFWEIYIIKCIYVRLQYKALITSYLDEIKHDRTADKLVKALKLAPQRIEAQLLLSRAAWPKRDPRTNAPDASFINDLSNDPRISYTINSLLEAPKQSEYLTNEAPTADPVVWLASILPEADQMNKTMMRKKAIALLKNRSSVEAIILQTLIKLELVSVDLSHAQTEMRREILVTQVETIKDKLEKLLKNRNKDGNIYEIHFYQEIADKLGQVTYLLGNKQDYMVCLNTVNFFKEVLDLREKQLLIQELPSMRPPEKLILYFIIRSTKATGEIFDRVRKIFLENPIFNKVFKDVILKEYSAYQDKERWFSGSMLDPNWENKYEKKLKEETLNTGWRY